jgi:hypothetical protein
MLPADTEEWIALLLAQKQVRSTTIVIVLGAEAWTISVEKAAPAATRGNSARSRAQAIAPAATRSPSTARAA